MTTYPTPKKKRALWPWLVLAALFAACGLGVAVATAGEPAPTAGSIVGEAAATTAKNLPSAALTTSSAAPAPTTVPAAPAKPKIGGDDLVHVGEDVPAGTYRAVHALEGGDMCYWSKSRDAEGDDIVDNDIPSGGRPQVTLKKGQWFTSQGCPDWLKK